MTDTDKALNIIRANIGNLRSERDALQEKINRIQGKIDGLREAEDVVMKFMPTKEVV